MTTRSESFLQASWAIRTAIHDGDENDDVLLELMNWVRGSLSLLMEWRILILQELLDL